MLATWHICSENGVLMMALRFFFSLFLCAVPLAELARFIIGGLDGLLLQFISDRDTNRARRHLDHLIKAVITLAEGADV